MGKFNHSKAGSSTADSCRCEMIEKKLNEAKKKLKKVFAKLDKLKKLAAKKVAKKVATLPLKAVPILGWAMAAYDVYDVVTTGIDIAEVVEEFNKEADIVNKLSDKLDACLGKKKQTGNGGAHKTTKPVDGGYAPKEGLPRDKHGHKVPSSDYPHTQLGTQTSKRKGTSYRQTREWGEKGDRGYDNMTPKRDIDWTDHGRSDHTNPHTHEYDLETGRRT